LVVNCSKNDGWWRLIEALEAYVLLAARQSTGRTSVIYRTVANADLEEVKGEKHGPTNPARGDSQPVPGPACFGGRAEPASKR
jgi:hypothetical protein